MENMGAAALLLPAAQATLTSLLLLLTEQIKLAWGFKGGLKKLQRRLNNIQALLRDADNKQIESEALKEWLKSLKSVTCHAENVLSEFAYEALRRKLEVGNQMRYKVRNFFSPSNPLAFCLKMANRVNNINLLLDEICKEAHDMGLRPANQFMIALVSPNEHRPNTTPFLGKSHCVGRNHDVEVVRDMLLGSKDDLSVIAIVGIAGLGKTTLAQLVYHDKKVVELFGENRIWICVSNDFTEERLLNEMVENLFKVESKMSNIGALVGKLREKLMEKTYLLVLDDVWNEIPEKWEKFTSSLMGIGGSGGSKIIVTTRTKNVVFTMRVPESLVYPLRELSFNHSWTVFRERAFAKGGPMETPTVKEIGERMVEKCKGVPLAIKSLGGLMHHQKTIMDWKAIEESEIWRSTGEILPALRLSFYHLPSPSLKQCFAYCSIFPKDHLIIKDNLIQLWASLGYLQSPSDGNLEIEDVGDDYFNILLRNSLFQDVVLDEYNNVITCKMHDLALDASKGSCWTLKASEVKDHPDVQHLSLRLEEEMDLRLSNEAIGKLRSLFLDGYLPKNIEDIKSIRALTLVGFGGNELSSSICKFIHIKYLDLSSSSFEKLPNSISTLYNLETLRLPSSSEISEDIQTEFHKLVNLRHLFMEDTKKNRKMTPSMIGCLTSLQTLPFFSVGKDKGHKFEELGSLSKLRGRLRVYNLQHVKDEEEAKGAKISQKSKVTELKFHWDKNPGMLDINYGNVLEGLKPHENVRGLELRNFGGRSLASWMWNRDDRLLHNLVKIELINCKLCEDIPMLGHLPHLEVIVMANLDNMESISPKFYGFDERPVNIRSSVVATPATVVFPALKKLTIHGMPKLTEWSDVSWLPHATTSTIEFFPQLEELDIRGCPNLIAIPGHLLLRIQSFSITSRRNYIGREPPKGPKPCSTIEVDRHAKNIGTLIEYLVEKGSKFLRNLAIEGFDELCYLPKQLLNLSSLESLSVKWCPKLMCIGEQEGAEFHGCLTSLQELRIVDCEQLRYLPIGLLPSTLIKLDINGCSNLTVASPDELQNLTSLQELSIRWCGMLRCLPKGWLQPTLVSLVIRYCSNLTVTNPDELHNLTSLQELSIGWCGMLSCLPKGWSQPNLTSLAIVECSNLTVASPEELCNLTSLHNLTLKGCNSVEWARCWEEGQFCLTNLQTLNIGPFSEELDYFPWPEIDMAKAENPQHYPFMSLKSLEIVGWPKLKCLPDQLRHLTSLGTLVIEHFDGLEALPEWLGNFSYLRSLSLYWCPNLTRLPSLENCQRLKNLQSLGIWICPLLGARCQEGGEERHKIAHIPRISDCFRD